MLAYGIATQLCENIIAVTMTTVKNKFIFVWISHTNLRQNHAHKTKSVLVNSRHCRRNFCCSRRLKLATADTARRCEPSPINSFSS